MNKTIIFTGSGLILALSLIFLLAFNRDPVLTPVDTIKSFHKAATSGQIAESKEFVTNDILKSFENGGFPNYGSYGNFISEYKSKTKKIHPISKSVKIKGNSASLKVDVTYTNNRKSTETYNLIKEDGQWKIAE